jgi:hypothetical protein
MPGAARERLRWRLHRKFAIVKPYVHLLLAFAAAALVPARIAAADDVPGHVVLAKPGGDAIMIWDATPVIVTIVAAKLSDEAANALLERDALRDVAKLAKSLDPDAKTVALRVTYQKIGAVNPAYGAQTFSGVERYALVTMSGADVRGDRDRWMELSDTASPPAWIRFSVTGQLPPRS